ncbi:DNA recombination protein RmuC [Paenimyroides tangerinum]|uniref:DNA recombination protein RmuC n=1 Tax=Paenimyroides tangerinum TaxID=2488728 RepID=A0A3P3W367_9FLAO|nr:DNA recombination protein RmuC [Paenimyroides tangerinum]RRJ89552.1 DNA recombination protein RmuC [Paenimyroides tangerinum]
MSVYLIYFILFILAFLIGILIQRLISNSKINQLNSESKQHLYQLEIERNRFQETKLELENLRLERDDLFSEYSKSNSELNFLKTKLDDQKKEIEKLQIKFTETFENLANRILDEKSEKFTATNKIQIENILNPLQEKIKSFEERVEITHKDQLIQQTSLKEQITFLSSLNKQMTQETINLTNALKGDSKVQGNWGEVILERILEKSGLEKDREYEVQKSFNLEGKRLQPDVVIHLPNDKKMIIDSKVSLTAYERYCNETDEIEKQNFLKQHILSVANHIKQLSEKNYQHIYEVASPDFILMFVPIETAFALAINNEPNLYNQAFEKNIVIVTTSTLLATLKTIDSLWKNEKQQNNALEIAKQAGLLYDKFVGFVEDIQNIEKNIDRSKLDIEKAKNKLFLGNGNLVNAADKIVQLGAKAKKKLQ